MFDGELQREITLSTQDAYKLSNNAIKFYQQAEDLLLEELGISDFEIPQDLTYVVSFSEFENANCGAYGRAILLHSLIAKNDTSSIDVLLNALKDHDDAVRAQWSWQSRQKE